MSYPINFCTKLLTKAKVVVIRYSGSESEDDQEEIAVPVDDQVE